MTTGNIFTGKCNPKSDTHISGTLLRQCGLLGDDSDELSAKRMHVTLSRRVSRRRIIQGPLSSLCSRGLHFGSTKVMECTPFKYKHATP